MTTEEQPNPAFRRARLRQRPAWIASLIVALGSGMPVTAWAADDANGVWGVFTATGAIGAEDGSGRWQYLFDAQARYFDLGSGANQYLVRPGLAYRINDTVGAGAGYARLRARSASGNTAYEDRFWQQLTWSAGRWNNGNIAMRARLEQRLVSSGNDVGLVLRLSTKYTRPLGRTGKTSLILGIEPFVKLRDTDWSGSSGLGQNRTSIGIGWRASSKLTVETSYMNQFVWRDDDEDRRNHILVVNFKFKL
jgi:hypothetical protein